MVASFVAGLEHFPEKWSPVFRKKMRPLNKAALFRTALIALTLIRSGRRPES